MTGPETSSPPTKLNDSPAFGLIVTALFSLAFVAFAAGWLIVGTAITGALIVAGVVERLRGRRPR